jgi:hypothetical protein
MAALAGLSGVLCAIAWWRYDKAVQAWLFVLCVILTALPLAACRWLLPSMLREAALRYAESIWLCFLHSCGGTPVQGGQAK